MKKCHVNLSKRKIWSIALIVIMFVMSLGYAALSQHMDIVGITVIDKNWIVKISQVDKTTYETATESHTYVSSTLSLNAELPKDNSKVEYIVKVENLGNVIASGTIETSMSEVNEILVEDEFLTATSDGDTKYYYIVLEYPNLEEAQNSDIGGTFSGEVIVEESDNKEQDERDIKEIK